MRWLAGAVWLICGCGRVAFEPADAGGFDAGVVRFDAGARDAATDPSGDAGGVDAGTFDAAHVDAGAFDASIVDASIVPIDAGSFVDAGITLMSDTGIMGMSDASVMAMSDAGPGPPSPPRLFAQVGVTLRTVNRSTGETAPFASIGGGADAFYMTGPIIHRSRRLAYIQTGIGGFAPRIATIDLTVGGVVPSVPLATSFYFLYVNPSDELRGIGATGRRHEIIEPVTGALTSAGIFTVSPESYGTAYDPARNLTYIENGTMLVAFDETSTPVPAESFELGSRIDMMRDGGLSIFYGLRNPGRDLVRIDLIAHSVTTIRAAVVSGYLEGTVVIDHAHGEMLLVEPMRTLVTINLGTGAATRVTLDMFVGGLMLE